MNRVRLVVGVLLSVGCVGTPSVGGVAGTAPAPDKAWAPPPPPRDTLPSAASSLPTDLASRVNTLTLGDVVDLALRNNPETQISWANARAAAAAYGGSKGLYYPTIDAQIGVNRVRSSPTFSNDSVLRPSLMQTNYGPTFSVSWLIADLGGRAGTIESAKQALIAANWTHNATIQNVVLQVESAYFNYMANKGLVESERLSVKEAQTSLESTQERQRVGLATIADVLQAKTALSQATLTLETTEGDLQTTRGALAAAMGLPANVPYDIDAAPATAVGPATDSVDALIAAAVKSRPDLASAQAQYRQAVANVRATRGNLFPSIRATGTGGRTYVQYTSQWRNELHTVDRTRDPHLLGLLPAVRGEAGARRSRCGARSRGIGEAAGAVSGLQLVLRAADRGAAGKYRGRSARERAVFRGRGTRPVSCGRWTIRRSAHRAERTRIRARAAGAGTVDMADGARPARARHRRPRYQRRNMNIRVTPDTTREAPPK